jgi:hypothetical protein
MTSRNRVASDRKRFVVAAVAKTMRFFKDLLAWRLIDGISEMRTKTSKLLLFYPALAKALSCWFGAPRGLDRRTVGVRDD